MNATENKCYSEMKQAARNVRRWANELETKLEEARGRCDSWDCARGDMRSIFAALVDVEQQIAEGVNELEA